MNKQQFTDPEIDQITRQLMSGTTEKPTEPLCARIMSRVMAEKRRANQKPAPSTLSPAALIGFGLVYLIVLISLIGGWAWLTKGDILANNWSVMVPSLLFSLIPVCGLSFFLLFNQLDEYLKSRRR